MKEKLEALIKKLEQENKERAQTLAYSYNTGNLDLIYRTTEDIIRQLKNVL